MNIVSVRAPFVLAIWAMHALLAGAAAAQTIAGRVVEDGSRLPLQRVTVILLADSARELSRTTTDTTGAFYLDVPAAGSYRVRFSLDSTLAYDSAPIAVGSADFIERQFIVPMLPRVYFDFQVTTPVKVLAESPPRYPADLRRMGIQGEVVAQFVVESSGGVRPGSFKVIRATDMRLVPPVQAAVFAARFAPAELSGEKVAQLVQQPFTFGFRRPLGEPRP